MRRASAAAAGLAAALAVACLGAPSAAAAGSDDGLWYLTATGIQQVHASGVTGEGITVAVLDGPIYPELPELVGSNLEVQQDSFCDKDGDGVVEPAVADDGRAAHASTMAALIVGSGAPTDGQPGVTGVAPGATVRHYAIESDWGSGEAACQAGERNAATAALEQALDDGVDIVSMSFAGTGWGPEADEVVARAIREGVILVGASNHEGGDFLGTPADFNGAIGVEAADAAAQRGAQNVVSPRLDVVAPGEGMLVHEFDEAAGTWTRFTRLSGSSDATAWTAGVLALAWSAHPDATGNQMIQALVRTTTQNAGELRRVDDAWGYGLVNVNNLMQVDPTDYPDENPLITDTYGDIPSVEQIFPDGTTEPTPEPTEPGRVTDGPTGSAAEGADGSPGGVPPAALLGGAAVLVALAAVGAVLFARSRRRSAVATPSGGYPAPPGPPQPPTGYDRG